MTNISKEENKKVVLYLPGSVGDNFIVLSLAQQLKDNNIKGIVIAVNNSLDTYRSISKDLAVSDEVFSARNIFFLLKLFFQSFFKDTYFIFFLTPDSKLISYTSFVFHYLSRVKMISFLFTDIHKKPHFFGDNIMCSEKNTVQELFSFIFDRLNIKSVAKNPYLELPVFNRGNYSVLHLYPSAPDRKIEKEDIKKGIVDYYKEHMNMATTMVITGAPSDIVKDISLEDYIPNEFNYLDLRGRLSLVSLMYVIHDAESYFGVHTGPTHIGAMFNKRGIAFYKKERPVVSVRYNSNYKVISLD